MPFPAAPVAAAADGLADRVILGVPDGAAALDVGSTLDTPDEAAEEADKVELEEALATREPPPEGTPGGGGRAVEGSARAPMPQGMFSPVPGCLALAGGTEEPSVAAIVKRVVQVLTGLPGEVNW